MEVVDRRVLGALRIVDATTRLLVDGAIRIEAPGLRLVRNRRGDFVIFSATGLGSHTRTFTRPPDEPAIEAKGFPLQLTDLAGRYLPRRASIKLPRDPDPKAGNSVFAAAQIPLYSAPSRTAELSWGVIRATVRDENTKERLPWAFVHVLDASKNTELSAGLADARGEALIPVPGIKVSMPAGGNGGGGGAGGGGGGGGGAGGGGGGAGNGGVLTTKLDVKLTVAFDTALVKLSDEDLATRQAAGNMADANPGYLPDPDTLSGQPAKAAKLQIGGAQPADTGSLASGSVLVADLLVSLA